MYFPHSRQNGPFIKYKSYSVILLKLYQSFPLPSKGKANSFKWLISPRRSGFTDYLGLPSCHVLLHSSLTVFLAVSPTHQAVPQDLYTCVLSWNGLSLGIPMTYPLLRCHLIREAFPSTNIKSKSSHFSSTHPSCKTSFLLLSFLFLQSTLHHLICMFIICLPTAGT